MALSHPSALCCYKEKFQIDFKENFFFSHPLLYRLNSLENFNCPLRSMILHLKSCKDKLLKFIRRVMHTHSKERVKMKRRKKVENFMFNYQQVCLISLLFKTLYKNVSESCYTCFTITAIAMKMIWPFWWKGSNSREKINISPYMMSIDEQNKFLQSIFLPLWNSLSHWRDFFSCTPIYI